MKVWLPLKHQIGKICYCMITDKNYEFKLETPAWQQNLNRVATLFDILHVESD